MIARPRGAVSLAAPPAVPESVTGRGSSGEDPDERSRDDQRLLREVLEAQRDELLVLRRRGAVGDEVMRRVERDLDPEGTRLDG